MKEFSEFLQNAFGTTIKKASKEILVQAIDNYEGGEEVTVIESDELPLLHYYIKEDKPVNNIIVSFSGNNIPLVITEEGTTIYRE